MFSREDASRLKEEFWATFGRYMRPVLSAEGKKISWVNYHTGIKDVYFRMDAEKRSARISISLEQRDLGIQELFFEQFRELEKVLHQTLNERWTWQLHATSGKGKIASIIYKEGADVSVLNKEHWPSLISFFKPRIIALDAFWTDAKWSFDALK